MMMMMMMMRLSLYAPFLRYGDLLAENCLSSVRVTDY